MREIVRDWDLIREILRRVESAPDSQVSSSGLSIEDYPGPVISGHVRLLKDRGLIEAVDASSRDGEVYLIRTFARRTGSCKLET